MNQDNLKKVNGDGNLYARVAKWLTAHDDLDKLASYGWIEEKRLLFEQAEQIMEEVYHSANKPQDLREVRG